MKERAVLWGQTEWEVSNQLISLTSRETGKDITGFGKAHGRFQSINFPNE